MHRASQLRRVLAERIAPLPWVGDVRQRGLMVGIELVRDRASQEPFPWDEFRGVRVCNAVREHGVVLRPLGDVVVWMPPLSLTASEADLLGEATARAVEAACR